ncbi:MAG TPA: SIMPL domain-containing protein, partial [Methanoculleus sp.]|nr:SIMPL domain-containing protein [Methanoculleus sp.]
AQQQNAQRMDAVINALKAAGIPAKDIKTAGYNIIPVTDTDDSGLITSKVRYYRVVNTLQVTLNDVGRAGEVVDLAVENGANRVNSLAFTLSDEKQQEYRSQALTAAVAQARGDADAVAAALGKSIVDVKEVNVGGSYVPMAYDNRYVMEQAAGAGVKTTPLEVGEIELTASVYITYTLS